MATKTFNDICVEYAHQLGKGLPLTAPEMCNAVIMYLNSQITEMEGITTALQTAVSEAEASATEATNKADDVSEKVDALQTAVTEAESNATEALNTANSASEKVDTLQTNVTEAEASATEALNKANDVSETVNALPKVPKPTTSDNGKVIGVQSGAYALVEQSGGEAPANMYTTDSAQTIAVNKGSSGVYYTNNEINATDYSNDDLDKIVSGEQLKVYPDFGTKIIPGVCTVMQNPNHPPIQNRKVLLTSKDAILPGSYGNFLVMYGLNSITVSKYRSSDRFDIDTYKYDFPAKSGAFALQSDIPSLGYFNNDIVIVNSTKNGNSINIHDTTPSSSYTRYGYGNIKKYGDMNELQYTLNIPDKNGILAILDDIPDLDNYTGTVHIVEGTAGSGIAVHDTANNSPYTKYGYDKIETYGNSNALQYTLNIPNKNGTIATLDDISSTPSTSRYFTRVIYHSTDDDTQYIIFSCITDTDLSANTSYQNVIDLLNNLGATTQNTALPCTGKTGSGDIVVGVYTDGSNIIVFNTDSTTEELSMSAEIKFISK